MQVAKTLVRCVEKNIASLSEKEMIILSEIGLEDIPTATSFVEYISEKYAISPSGVWYTLKKLKEKRVVDFTERGRGEDYKPLSLTESGEDILRKRSAEFHTRPMGQEQMRVGPSFSY